MTATDKTQIDFYILQDDSRRSILQFCCRLTEKAWKLGNDVQIRTNDAEETRQLDDMLWTYRDESFLPHSTQEEKVETPIIIGHEPDTSSCDLLINLASDSPDHIERYPRVAEILNDDETIKQHGRTRYSAYKQAGLGVQHHQIG